MRRSVVLGLCALLAPFAPVAAVDTFVPLAANVSLGASTYRTLLIITNTGSSNASFTVGFIPGGTDGTTAAPPASYGLSPGTTLRLYDRVPPGSRGMLAVSGTAQLAVSARVEALGANGNVVASSEVPVVTAAGAVGPGQHVQLQGLEQAPAGATTDFALLNLASGPAQCTVQAFRSDGSRIAATASLALPPRSERDFAAALGTLGATSIRDARFDVTCDQPFATYALVYRSGGPETVLLSPAAGLDGDLTPDASGDVTFNLPGQFANGTAYASYNLPLHDGVQYARAHMELDVFIDRWHEVFPFNPNFETVASFRRTGKRRQDRVLYCGLIIKGTGSYNTILDMGIPPGAPGAIDGTTLRSGKGPWQERTSYHLVFDYDADGGGIVFSAYQGGRLVQQMTGAVNNTDISNQADKTVLVDFSAAGIGDGAYFPTAGWKYSNLTVQLTPRSH